MWITPYHRDLIPEGFDHAGFGQEIGQFSLIDSMSGFAGERTIRQFSSFGMPTSDIYGDVAETLSVYRSCTASFRAAASSGLDTSLFLPDHAAVVRQGDAIGLISESLWHSELFFSSWFRNDRTTDWRWRADAGWPDETTFGQSVGVAYHRFHFSTSTGSSIACQESGS